MEQIDHSAHGHDMTMHAHHQMMDNTGDHMDHAPPMHGDHGSHGDGMGHGHGHESMPMMMMMTMVFHFGCKEVILFEQWSIDSVGGLIASILVIALMGTCYEGLKYYREYLFWKTYNSLQYRAVTLPEKSAVVGASSEDTTRVQPTMTSAMHIYQTFLHIIQVTLSFLLMLIFMTYNVWLCLAVVVGAAIGYFLFGWKKSVIVDVTEHCH